MNSHTLLPVDQLAQLWVVGANRQKVEPLANERVIRIDRDDDCVKIMFQARACDKVNNRFVTLKPVKNLDDGEYWQFDTEIKFDVNAPFQSRTGTASAPLPTRWIDQKNVRYSHRRYAPSQIPAIRTGWEKPDDAQPSKMPLDAETVAKALSRLTPNQHTWYKDRLVRDHGPEIGKAAFKAGMTLYILEY